MPRRKNKHKNLRYPEIMQEIRNRLTEENRAENTIISYQKTTTELLDLINKPVEELTYNDIYEWRDWVTKKKITKRGKKHYPNTFSNSFSAINKFCEVYKIKDRDGQFLRLIAPRRIEPEHGRVKLTREEVERLYEATKDDPRNYAMFRVMVETFLRVSELIHLNVDDLEIVIINGVTKYRFQIGTSEFTPKAQSFRKTYFSEDTYKAIQRWLLVRKILPDTPHYSEIIKIQQQRLKTALAQNNKPEIRRAKTYIGMLELQHRKVVDSEKALFHSSWHYRLDRSDVCRTIKEYAIVCHIDKKLHCHSFRHTGINFWKQAGKSYDQIKGQSGHKSSKTLDIYGNLDEEQQSECFDDVYAKKTEIPIKQEIKEQPKPDVIQEINIKDQELKLKMLELELANKNAEIELLKLRDKGRSPNNNQTYIG